MAQQLVAVDQRNPIAASRMLKLFMGWRRYSPERQQLMRSSLEWLSENLTSPNSKEVVMLCLAQLTRRWVEVHEGLSLQPCLLRDERYKTPIGEM